MSLFIRKIRDLKISTAYVFVVIVLLMTGCGYLAVNPPPDVRLQADQFDQSNWQAVAADMLAVAGYGEGINIQERAEIIYQQINGFFGSRMPGWTDAALEWWLDSDYNLWPDNPYRIVNFIGHKFPRIPVNDTRLTSDIARLLREGNIVAVSLSWPDTKMDATGAGGHTLLVIGDDLGPKPKDRFPEHLRVTDPFRDKGGNIQTYVCRWIGSLNEANGKNMPGWYLSYSENTPYIKGLTVLERIKRPATWFSQHQTTPGLPTVNLTTFKVDVPDSHTISSIECSIAADSSILSCDPGTEQPLRRAASVSYDPDHDSVVHVLCNLNRNGTGEDEMLSLFSRIYLPGAHQTVAGKTVIELDKGNNVLTHPHFSWKMEFEKVSALTTGHICGGYIVASIGVERVNDTLSLPPLSEIRFLTRYHMDESPLYHQLSLGGDQDYRVTTVKLGHSDGILTPSDLWDFEDWITQKTVNEIISERPVIKSNWYGKYRYPAGEEYYKREEVYQDK